MFNIFRYDNLTYYEESVSKLNSLWDCDINEPKEIFLG